MCLCLCIKLHYFPGRVKSFFPPSASSHFAEGGNKESRAETAGKSLWFFRFLRFLRFLRFFGFPFGGFGLGRGWAPPGFWPGFGPALVSSRGEAGGEGRNPFFRRKLCNLHNPPDPPEPGAFFDRDAVRVPEAVRASGRGSPSSGALGRSRARQGLRWRRPGALEGRTGPGRA